MRETHKKRTTVLNTNLDEDAKFKVSESYKMTRTDITYSVVKAGCKKIVFSSSLAKEGKSTSSVNVAISLAEQVNVKVLLIDADLRKPKVHRFFNISHKPGLSDVLVKVSTLEDALQPVNKNLTVLCAGVMVPNPSELLASNEMAFLLKLVEDDYDYIIIDSPPLNVVVDALPLIKLSDGVVIVLRAGSSTHTELTKTIKNLEMVEAKILGFILNGCKTEKKDSYKYRYYD